MKNFNVTVYFNDFAGDDYLCETLDVAAENKDDAIEQAIKLLYERGTLEAIALDDQEY